MTGPRHVLMITALFFSAAKDGAEGAERRAQGALAKLNGGADIGDLAATLSDDPTTREIRGKKVARRAAAFDMRIQYYDIARLTEDQEDALGVRFALFTEILKTSDIVTLHVPLNDVTRKMISTRELAMMKKTAILINTCRGPVIDEDALYTALTSGQIGAAGLDVMVEEPPKRDHPLFKLPNVTFTPHSAGPTWENWTARLRNGFDNIQRVAAGRAPKWTVFDMSP